MATLTNVVFLVAILNVNLVRSDCEATSKVLRLKNKSKKDEKSPRDNSDRGINSVDEFWQKRNAIADLEIERLLGNRAILRNEKETEVNSIILETKQREYEQLPYIPSIRFQQAKSLMEKSELFHIIKDIPKGANLYGTLLTSVEPDFYYQLTYEENLYFRFEDNLKLKYSKEPPSPGWRLLSRLRNTGITEYVEDLNNAIKETLRLSLQGYLDEETAWNKLENILDVYTALTNYKPNFIKVFRRTLEILYEDNVMYAELRYHFPQLYDLNTNVTTPVGTLFICQSILEDFIKTHEGFKGIRFIYAPTGEIKPEKMNEYREAAVTLWKTLPNLVAGFGFIRREFLGQPLANFVPELLKFPKEMKLFFTAGLTKDWGINSDYNLLDALTLKSARISEGFALNKHPVVLNQLQEKGIAVELCPILAQSLNYVQDLRMHPNVALFARDFPVVIGNVGGSFWNATGLSYDWYEAYMAMTPRFCDLRCLKQLALNSWLYSTLSSEEKKNAIKDWQIKWDIFVDNILKRDRLQ